jgi:anti-sigma factor RsiW
MKINVLVKGLTCISEQLLQKYIDGECAGNETAMIKQHLEGCLACHQKHAEMEKLSAGIKSAINSLIIDNDLLKTT